MDLAPVVTAESVVQRPQVVVQVALVMVAAQRLLLALVATKLPLGETSVVVLDGATPQRLVASRPSAVALLKTSLWA